MRAGDARECQRLELSVERVAGGNGRAQPNRIAASNAPTRVTIRPPKRIADRLAASVGETAAMRVETATVNKSFDDVVMNRV